MIIDRTTKNRLVIFLFFDKDGIADRYIFRMLEDLRQDARTILTVVNGYAETETRRKLEEHSDEVLYRPNVGFDLGGYRDGIFHLGFKTLGTYDEVILMNYTFFGPLKTFHTMFEEMAGHDVDFWGITKHHRIDDNPFKGRIPYDYFPEHLNSHFFALRKNFVRSWSWREFMINRKNPESYTDSITDYEAIFTKYFEDLGFVWEEYVHSDYLKEMNRAPFAYLAADLIRDSGCPIIKRRNFFGDYTVFLQNTAGENSVRAYEAMKETGYDTGLVWDNILRLQDPAEIRQVMHVARYPSVKATKHIFRAGEACAVVFGGKERVLALAGSYLESLEDDIPVFFEEGALTYAEKLSRAAELAAGFAHVLVLDPLGIPSFGDPKSSRASVLYGELESLIASRPFVGNVLDIFENENRIGLMVPPLPVYGNYFENLGDGYAGHFGEAVKLARELGVSFPVSDKNPPAYSLGGGFWAKSEVLKAAAEKLSGHGEADELLMKIVLPYLFQAEGCLTATLTGSRYAGTYATNLDYAMRENNKVVFERFGPDYFWSEIDKINKRD